MSFVMTQGFLVSSVLTYLINLTDLKIGRFLVQEVNRTTRRDLFKV